MAGAGQGSELAAPGTAPSRDSICWWPGALCKRLMHAGARPLSWSCSPWPRSTYRQPGCRPKAGALPVPQG